LPRWVGTALRRRPHAATSVFSGTAAGWPGGPAVARR
jgi:hypothetical protein